MVFSPLSEITVISEPLAGPINPLRSSILSVSTIAGVWPFEDVGFPLWKKFFVQSRIYNKVNLSHL